MNPNGFISDQDGTTVSERPVMWTNYIIPGYQIDTGIAIGALLTLGVFPFKNSESIKLDDLAIRVYPSPTLQKKNTSKLMTDLSIFSPMTDYSKKMNP